MFRLFISLLCSVFSFTAFGENIARNQDTTRTERTLRVDYDFSGNAEVQHIALSELCSLPGWAGRNVNMDSVPLHGNGDITLTDVATHKVIYRQSFSTLFQEWLRRRPLRLHRLSSHLFWLTRTRRRLLASRLVRLTIRTMSSLLLRLRLLK